MPKKRISLTIEEEIYKKFMSYCKKKAMKVSSKVELLMREEMKKNEK